MTIGFELLQLGQKGRLEDKKDLVLHRDLPLLHEPDLDLGLVDVVDPQYLAIDLSVLDPLALLHDALSIVLDLHIRAVLQAFHVLRCQIIDHIQT